MAHLGEPLKKEQSVYHFLIGGFFQELDILTQLNVRLAKSIEDMKKQAKDAFHEKVKDLDPEARKNFVEFGKALGSLDFKTKKEMSFQLDDKVGKMIFEMAKEGIIVPDGFLNFIRDMGLVYLVAKFDDFIKNSLVITFSNKPEMLSTCKKSVTLEELMKVKNLKTVKQDIIEKEAEEVSNRDIEEIRDFFDERMNIDLSQFANWTEFKERFYRRNIIIHNSGWANDVYRKKTRSQTGKHSKNQRLTVSKEYLDESISMFKTIAQTLVKSLDDKFGKTAL